jgi:uncharacterized protein YndB with AHSA1/START domain
MTGSGEPAAIASLHDRWVRARRLLDAPPDRVHRAWTDPEELAAWFCRVVEGSLLVGARSVLVWSDRTVNVDVLESEPPVRFRFRWSLMPDGSGPTVVTVTIERNGFGSRVTLEDGPFDLTVPGGADAFGEAATGWGDALANLRARVDFGVDLRRPLR